MSHKRHVLKVFSLAVMAALAITAFAGASAQAHNWTVEGTKLASGESREVEAALKAGTVATLKGKLLGQEFVLTATTLSSSGIGGGEATIVQAGTVAKDEGVLEFSGLTVDKPAGCTVTSPIVTKPLTSELVTHGLSTTAYDKFFPEEGTTFATITVKGCAVAGTYPVKGTVYGEGEAWGTELVNQPLDFSPAINTTLGGALTLGTSAAELTAEGTNRLVGAAEGKAFGAE